MSGYPPDGFADVGCLQKMADLLELLDRGEFEARDKRAAERADEEEMRITEKHTQRQTEEAHTPPSPPPINIAFYTELQQTDQAAKPASLSAVVCVDGERFGSFEASSAFRWSPSTVGIYPAMRVSVRDNHFVGQQKQVYQQARAARRKRGEDVSSITVAGLDANEYLDDYCEEEWEFDPALLLELKAEWCTIDMVDGEIRALGVNIFEGRCFGKISFTVKDLARPMVGRSINAQFPAKSEQGQYSQAAATAKVYTIYVDANKKHLQQPFDAYVEIILAARRLSADGLPRNDWFFTRDERYRTDAISRFQSFIERSDYELPTRGWLVRAGDNGEEVHHQVYPTAPSRSSAPRPKFTTMQAYEDHFMPALLYERTETRRAQAALFNTDSKYPAEFQHMGGNDWLIKIKLKGAAVIRRGAKVTPHAKSSVQVLIEGVSDLGDRTSIFDGTVAELKPYDADFAVVAAQPFALQGDEHFELEDGAVHAVHILWHGEDADNHRKMHAVRSACVEGEKPRPLKDVEIMSGKTRDLFYLRDIFADQEKLSFSYPLLDLFAREHPTEERTVDLVRRLPTHSGLNVAQQSFIHAALDGVPCAVIMLEGFPGTGKSKTLGCLTMMLVLTGHRVLVQSQSNKGVDALFESAVQMVSKHDRADLLDDFVRMRSEVLEESLAQQLESGLVPVGDEFVAANYWMAACIKRFMRRNPGNPVVVEYAAHLRARREKRRLTSCRPWKMVVVEMRNKILEKATVVGTTAFVATTLGDTDFVADVVVFDEAGQATDPDLAMGITKQLTKLKLLVLSGDTAQLGPVVQSALANRNSLGSVLEVSALQRMKQAYPHFTRIDLTQNYRGHPSTFAMASNMFYLGQMVPGGNLARWDTPLARKVLGILSGYDFRNAFRNRALALKDNRQFFVNVPGEPQLEVNGTSWYNPTGIRALVAFTRMLLDHGVKPSDIGIISMYGEDVRRIIQQLEASGVRQTADDEEAADPEVCTVVGFQGREKKIILVHFVAAFRARNDPFGFIKQPRRLNVATTRSQEFQFMFGDMNCWARWMDGTAELLINSAGKMKELITWVQDKGQIVDWARVSLAARSRHPEQPWAA
ncbi:hypothetical protein LTR53_006195 [Teratosphaeriaceae sp. CCFEE 6253]|nr:hypothetical protein LTR53_006195 [Teratosphaeriaceae sp. CCFEE 6253]